MTQDLDGMMSFFCKIAICAVRNPPSADTPEELADFVLCVLEDDEVVLVLHEPDYGAGIEAGGM